MFQRNTSRNKRQRVFKEIDCKVMLPINGRPTMFPALGTDQSLFGVRTDSEGTTYVLCEGMAETLRFYDQFAEKPDITIGWASGCTPTEPWAPPASGQPYVSV